MFLFNLILTAIAVYFVKQEYEYRRTGWAIFWAILLGWDLHVLLSSL